MFHTPAHKQTDPAKLPGQIVTSYPPKTTAKAGEDRACATCVDRLQPIHRAPCDLCMPADPVNLPYWRPKAAPLASRPDPGVRAIEALQEIVALLKERQRKLDEKGEADDFWPLVEAMEKVETIAANALATVAQQQAADFVPVTGETLAA